MKESLSSTSVNFLFPEILKSDLILDFYSRTEVSNLPAGHVGGESALLISSSLSFPIFPVFRFF